MSTKTQQDTTVIDAHINECIEQLKTLLDERQAMRDVKKLKITALKVEVSSGIRGPKLCFWAHKDGDTFCGYSFRSLQEAIDDFKRTF